MTKPMATNTDCLFLGEFVDEMEVPSDMAFHSGEAVRTRMVATYLDTGNNDDENKTFTVALEDGSVASVRGHGLQVLQPSHPGGFTHYAIVEHGVSGEVIIGLFRTDQVRCIFSGEMQGAGAKG